MFSLPGFSQNFAWWGAIPIALLPAALHWWSTRHLSGPATTPERTVLPERYLAVTQRVAAATSFCAVLVCVLTGWGALWIVPLQLLALECARYPTRRALLGETWPLHRYLTWRIRLFIGASGFVWFFAFAPALVVVSPDSSRWGAAGVLLMIGFAWHHWYGRVLLAVIGASPLSRPDLDAEFADVIRRSTLAPPPVWRAGEPGGVFANALALPSFDLTGVIMFDTLLERLSPPQIAAIYAHEIAHLEHFDRRLVTRTYAATVTLMTVLIVTAAAGGRFINGFKMWMPAVSITVVCAALWLRARRMQPKETAADRRAVELCGNPEALISGLMRLYEINHVPRRWSAQMDERATHPSLARRINAIRQHTSPAPAPVEIERLVIASPDAGRLAFIDRDRVGFLWYDGGATDVGADVFERARRAEMVAFTDLSELRLAAVGRIALALIAIDRRGQRWSIAVHEADAERVQATLDRVDHLIVAPVATDRAVWQRLMLIAVMALAAMFNAVVAMLAPALLSLRRPSRPLMIAVSTALTTTALLKAEAATVGWIGMIVLATLAAVTLLVSHRSREGQAGVTPPWNWLERLTLALPVAVGLLLIAGSTVDLFDLHIAVRDRSWFPAGFASLAVYLSLSPERVSRRLGALTGTIATIFLAIGSPWFLLGVVRDPLATNMPVLIETRVPLAVSSRRSLEGEFTSVAVARDGNTFLLAVEEEEPEDDDAPPVPRRYLTGTFNGSTRTFQASEAVLIDEQRVLALDRERGISRLHADDVRTGEVFWTLPLADAEASMLQTSPNGRWRAIARQRNRFTRIEGRIGTTDANTTSWTIASTGEKYVSALRVDTGAIALAQATAWQRPPAPWLDLQWRQTTTLMSADLGRTRTVATSRLTVDCAAPPIGINGYVCVSFDGRWSRFWRIDSATGQLRPSAQVRDAFWRVQQHTPSRVIGQMNGRPVLVDLDAHQLQSLTPPRDGCWMTDFAVADEVIVGLCAERGMTTAIRYRVSNRAGGASSTERDSARMTREPHVLLSRR